jgi:ABC-type transport system substrate-binding protein
MITRLTAVTIVAALAAFTARGDSITVKGTAHTDVLVYKGSGSYYVKLPAEGRVVHVPQSEIDASTVVINDDPYYRDELQTKFDATKAKVDAGEPVAKTTDSKFLAAAAETASAPAGGDVDITALLGGGGGGGGAMAAQAGALAKQLQQFGFKVEQSSGGFRATAPDGQSTISMQAAGAGVQFSVSALPQTAPQLMMGMNQGMMQMLPPGQKKWLQSQAGALSGPTANIQNTADGVSLKINKTTSAQKVDLTVTMSAS